MEFIPMSTIDDRYYIYLNNEVIGILEYKIYDDELEVKYIKIYHNCCVRFIFFKEFFYIVWAITYQ